MNASLEAREPVARYLATPPLLRHFDRVAQAPGGVARLRELILTLAVRGKLLPQNPADEPASVLLERIRTEKARLVKEGKIRKEKPLAAISEEEKPFALPEGWEWVRLPDVHYSISPSSNKLLASSIQEEGPYPVVDQGKRYIAGYTDIESLLIRLPGPVVIFGDHTTERKYVDFDFVAGADGVKILRPLQQNEKYFYYQLLGYRLEDRGYARHFKVLHSQLFALPPFSEQSRIVARVEELMALCDALEKKGRLEAAQHERLAGALFNALANSASAEEGADNWQRIAAHFDLLLDRPAAVDRLEQAILQLAVRGRLVPQNPSDEPASALLQRIRTEKDRLIATGQFKRDNPLPPISDEEKPFELPEGWEWTRFGDVSNISSGVTLGRKTLISNPISLPYLRVANVQRWQLALNDLKELTIDRSELGRFQLQKNDLLITEGGDWDKVGRTCIWNEQVSVCLHQNHVFRARGLSKEWNPVWAELYLNSSDARAYFASSAKQTTNLASINMTELKGCAFPTPPLPEQSRIVARVAELRALCAQLRERLTATAQTRSRLAEALLEQAVA